MAVRGEFCGFERAREIGWVAKGWVFDAEAPNEQVLLRLICDGKPIGDFRPISRNAESVGSVEQIGAQNFHVKLPHFLIDGNAHNVQIFVVKEGRTLPSTSQNIFLVKQHHGAVDFLEENALKGWAVDEVDVTRKVSVDISIDGIYITTLRCDQPYGDSLPYEFIGKACGFHFVIPEQYYDGARHNISVTFTNTKINLDGSPNSRVFSKYNVQEEDLRYFCKYRDVLESYFSVANPSGYGHYENNGRSENRTAPNDIKPLARLLATQDGHDAVHSGELISKIVSNNDSQRTVTAAFWVRLRHSCRFEAFVTFLGVSLDSEVVALNFRQADPLSFCVFVTAALPVEADLSAIGVCLNSALDGVQLAKSEEADFPCWVEQTRSSGKNLLHFKGWIATSDLSVCRVFLQEGNRTLPLDIRSFDREHTGEKGVWPDPEVFPVVWWTGMVDITSLSPGMFSLSTVVLRLTDGAVRRFEGSTVTVFPPFYFPQSRSTVRRKPGRRVSFAILHTDGCNAAMWQEALAEVGCIGAFLSFDELVAHERSLEDAGNVVTLIPLCERPPPRERLFRNIEAFLGAPDYHNIALPVLDEAISTEGDFLLVRRETLDLLLGVDPPPTDGQKKQTLLERLTNSTLNVMISDPKIVIYLEEVKTGISPREYIVCRGWVSCRGEAAPDLQLLGPSGALPVKVEWHARPDVWRSHQDHLQSLSRGFVLTVEWKDLTVGVHDYHVRVTVGHRNADVAINSISVPAILFHLEEPRSGGMVDPHATVIRGWTVSHDASNFSFVVTDGNQTRSFPVVWRVRPDIAAHVGLPDSQRVGFIGKADLSGMQLSHLKIRAFSAASFAEVSPSGLTEQAQRIEGIVNDLVWNSGEPKAVITGSVAFSHGDIRMVGVVANDAVLARGPAVLPSKGSKRLSPDMPLGQYCDFRLEVDLSERAGQEIKLQVVAMASKAVYPIKEMTVKVPLAFGSKGSRLRGALDVPIDGSMIPEKTPVPIAGWAVQTDGHRIGIRAYRDGVLIWEEEAKLKRSDVDEALNLPPGSLSKGFRLTLPCSLEPGEELSVRIVCCDMETGDVVDLGTRRVFGAAVNPMANSRLARWLDANSINRRSVEDAKALMLSWRQRPRISILMPHYRPKFEWLDRALESVDAQWYPHFEVCIADDASGDPIYRTNLTRLAAQYPWIRLGFCKKNGGIAAATNAAADLATGDYILFLDQDDEIAPNCLFELVKRLQTEPGLDIIYSDCDKIDTRGRRFDLTFKPDFDPDMLLSYMYMNHALIIRRSLFEKVGRIRLGFDGSQDYDLALRLVEHTSRIAHVPAVLYHWRVIPGSTALAGDEKPQAFDAGIRAVREALDRRGLPYKAVDRSLFAQKSRVGLYRVVWEIPEQPLVSIIIPSRNHAKLLQTCIASIEQVSTYTKYEIVIVDDRSDDPATLAYLAEVSHKVVRIPEQGQGFNFSALINAGAAAADGAYLLVLNDDTEVVTPGWMEELLGWARQPGVGVVGCRLLFPGGYIVQHAGLTMRLKGDAPGHLFRGEPAYSGGYYGWAQIARGVSAVTFAAAMIPRTVFDELNGLDSEDFPVAYQDPDFCLRARAAGYRVVYTAHAELIHYESLSKPRKFKDLADKLLFQLRWSDPDPMFNPNLVGLGETPAAAEARVLLTDPDARVRVAALVHNTKLQGAPISQLLLLRGLAVRHGFEVHVLASEEGPLLDSYREFAASVTMLTGLQDAACRAKVSEWLTALAPDVVYANTLETIWFVSLAVDLGYPPFWNIRESAVPATFFAGDNRRIQEAERCLAEAGRLGFVAEATASLFERARLKLALPLIIRNGVDLELFRPLRPEEPRHSQIAAYGIPPDAIVFGSVGTVCPRKGQHLAIRAFIEAQKAAPSLPIWFVSVGETQDHLIPYARIIDGIIAESPAPERILMLPEDHAIADWYRSFDVFVTAALEESFPRVVIEAMACGLPVVASNVFGIAEQVIPGCTGYAFDPGDISGMAGAMWRLAMDTALRDRMGTRGRAAAERLYGVDRMVDAYAREFRLLREELG